MAQTDNFTLLSPEISDAATLTATQEATGALVGNLQDIQPSKVWKSDNLTAVSMEVDMGSIVVLEQIALLFHNFTSAGTIRVRTADTQPDLTAAPTFDSTIEAYTQLEAAEPDLGDAFDRNHFFIHKNPVLNNQFLRFDFLDTSLPDGFFSIGRLVIGDAWQSLLNLSRIRFPQYIERSQEVTTLSQRLYTVERPIRRKFSGQLRFSEEADYLDNFDEFMRQRGGKKDTLFCLKPTEVARRHKRLFYGKMLVRPAQLSIGSKIRYTNTLEVNELI